MDEVIVKDKLAFLEAHLGKYIFNPRNNESVFFCPFCNHRKKKLTINLQSNIWNCWVCNQSGKGLQRIFKHLGDNVGLEIYEKFYNAIDKVTDKPEQSAQIKLPDGFVPIYGNDSFIAKVTKEYLTSRGIDINDILKYKLGMSSIDYRYKNRVIFPSFGKNGHLNYIVARTILQKEEIKYINSHVYSGYKNTIVINELNIDFGEPLVLVEGIFDLMKSVRNTVPLCSNDLNEKSVLFGEIVKNRTQIFLALDSDATKMSYKIAKKFLKYGNEVLFVDLLPYKDPGSITKHEFSERLKQAKNVTEKDLLLCRLY